MYCTYVREQYVAYPLYGYMKGCSVSLACRQLRFSLLSGQL